VGASVDNELFERRQPAPQELGVDQMGPDTELGQRRTADHTIR